MLQEPLYLVYAEQMKQRFVFCLERGSVREVHPLCLSVLDLINIDSQFETHTINVHRDFPACKCTISKNRTHGGRSLVGHNIVTWQRSSLSGPQSDHMAAVSGQQSGRCVKETWRLAEYRFSICVFVRTCVLMKRHQSETKYCSNSKYPSGRECK